MVHSWFHTNRTKTQTESKCESGIDSNTVLHSRSRSTHHEKTTTTKKRQKERLHTYAQEYKEEIQRVIEETRQHG